MGAKGLVDVDKIARSGSDTLIADSLANPRSADVVCSCYVWY